MPRNWHAHEADSAHAVDRGNFWGAVRLDWDPGRRPLLGHPGDFQAHLGAHRIRLPGPALGWGVHLQADRVSGEPAVKQHEGRTTRVNAKANTEEEVRRMLESVTTSWFVNFIVTLHAIKRLR